MTADSLAATGRLEPFAAAGYLSAADAQIARHLAHLMGEPDADATLAAALVLAALRSGSVCLDLAHAAELLPARGDLGRPEVALDWPEPARWAARLAASRLVTSGDGVSEGRPLRLDRGLLYLERSWDDQEQVARSIRARLAAPAAPAPGARERLDRFFPDSGRARDAAVTALQERFSVVGGGPGTGKTTTVARLIATLADPANPGRILLAAPTGKAAARLDESVRGQLAGLGLNRLAQAIPAAATVHRLLGVMPWGRVDYRADHLLPADLVIVDEVSMVSLHHMRLLLDAVPLPARLVLVGDPDQLASVEAGAVLADLVAGGGVPFTRLDRNWRFSGDLALFAAAIREGQADQVLALLDAAPPGLEFAETDLLGGASAALEPLKAAVVASGQAVQAALDRADWPAALAATGGHRLLCAHRQGPFGVARWGRQAEHWLAEAIPGYGRGGPWYPGLPVQVTRNDDVLGVYNGDTGVIVEVAGRPRVALAGASGLRLAGPAELDGLEPLHATTIHKAQGSQFESVTVIVPPPSAALLTRELLYTAVTRATGSVRLVGARESVAHAVAHRAPRASGLAGRLAALRPVRT
jgi:exodeoxyribonuclease V alpha subunit